MENLLMCRICIGDDIQLVSIVGTHLQEMYESLVLMPFETKDIRPILVCYICRAKLKNCYELRKRCLQSEELFTQMLNYNEPEQVQLQAINNKKRLTMHNVIHLSVGHEHWMNADNVGVEALKWEVKDEPNDDEDIGAYIVEENDVSDNMKSEESDDDFLLNVKEEQIGHRRSDSTTKELTRDEHRVSEGSTSSNLNGHELVQDAFKQLYEVTPADMPTDGSKEKSASVQYTCDTCQQCYSSKRELERHVRLCSNVWKKDLSRMKITNHTRDPLKIYTRTHTGEKPYHCNICKKQFSLKNGLKTHMRTHTDEIPYRCDICEKQFLFESRFTEHWRTHTGEKPYHCDKCKKQFSHKDTLIQHMHTHTGEKPYHCDICKKQFSYHQILSQHMRTHTGEKPYQCDICKKQFSQKSNLKRHMRIHTGEKSYHCDLSDKQFTHKQHESQITEHRRTHTDVKSYHCGICKNEFSDKDSLIQHMRTHTGVKLYHCDICKKRISQKSHFTTHNNLSTHTDEKPYLCDICKKQFSDPSPVFKKPSDGFLKTYSVLARRRHTAHHQS